MKQQTKTEKSILGIYRKISSIFSVFYLIMFLVNIWVIYKFFSPRIMPLKNLSLSQILSDGLTLCFLLFAAYELFSRLFILFRAFLKNDYPQMDDKRIFIGHIILLVMGIICGLFLAALTYILVATNVNSFLFSFFFRGFPLGFLLGAIISFVVKDPPILQEDLQ